MIYTEDNIKMGKSTILRGMTRDGSARLVVINSRDMVNGMREAHKTSPTATAALGRTITAASMIGTLLPADGDTVTISFSGDGEAGKIIAVGDYFGLSVNTISKNEEAFTKSVSTSFFAPNFGYGGHVCKKSVQNHYCKIQIPCKQEPRSVRYLQICRKRRKFLIE